jgi:ABC-type Fe3+/spermidine/putrescine transport system ATPase subunit
MQWKLQSTIVSLLLRFYDPESGSILLDGQDIRGMNIRWLRSQIGFVGQEPVLFSGSVSDNVKKGRVDMVSTPLLSLEEAMKISDAHRREQNEEEGSCCYSCCGKCSGAGSGNVNGDEQHANFAAKLSKKKNIGKDLTTPFIDPESGT